MADETPQEWPNQRLKILIPTWTLLFISTGFLIWRVVYGVMQKRKFMICDYLLITATALNVTATAISQVVVDAGQGRHIMDPSVLPNLMRYSYYLWISQVINIIAVAFLKWSICAWLLVLNFSKLYQGIVWLSILMVTAFNFLAPVLTLFGCTPLEKNWNYGYAGPGKCWAKGTLELSYTQGVSNIITDVVYMAAPLIYLSRVQLSRRTQWGIRVVFLLSIPATICSIFKTIELKAITKTMDPTWDGINLGIWSQAELSIGILIASLPPLRKPFDSLFKKILPSTMTKSKTPQYGYGTDGNIKMTTFNSRAYHSRIPGESILDRDDESDRAILEEGEGKGPGIMKTTQVTVVEQNGDSSSSQEESQGSYKQSNDWAQDGHHAR
ncbi:Nn.00g011710.m01.CDS01 [Neocucurbitaria sp. VM-36]